MATTSPLRFGYITNGLRDHRLSEALALLADLGYRGVGITLDVGHLDPRTSNRAEVAALRASLLRYGMEPVIETGARFILDPRRKHYPTLISAERRDERLAYLGYAVDIAEALGSTVVSFWSGARDPQIDVETTWRYLVEGIGQVERICGARGVRMGFEPEPGMFIESLDDFRTLRDRYRGEGLRLTLDLGHLEITEARPYATSIDEFAEILVNVHVDDIRDRVHEHLPPGEGDMDFAPLLEALRRIDYRGLALVELGRHSHRGPDVARDALAFLTRSQGTVV